MNDKKELIQHILDDANKMAYILKGKKYYSVYIDHSGNIVRNKDGIVIGKYH